MATPTVLQLDKICRTCLQVKKDMRPLFDELIVDMLMSCASVRISNTDGLPNQVCIQCVYQVSRCYAFKQKVERSDKQLHSFINPQKDEQSIKNDNKDISKCSDKSQDSRLELATFYASASVTPGPHICNLCNKDFKYYKMLETHMRSHSNWIEANCKMCSVCQRSFNSPGMLRVHMKTHEERPIREPSCTICHRVFKTKAILYRHRQTHFEQKSHPCTICEKNFISKYLLKVHLARHRGEKTHACEACDKTFYNTTDLKTMDSQQETRKQEAKILIKEEYIHSINQCIGEEFHEFPIEECEVDLKKEIEGHSVIENEDKLNIPMNNDCIVTGKKVSQMRHLKLHKLTHSCEKPHQCSVCGKSFYRMDRLKVHQLIHSGKKPHECRVCGKTFSEMGSLNRHKLTHSGEKPHECCVCGKKFSLKHHLKVHKLTHSGEKPHQCSVCGKTFLWMTSFKRHKLTHSDDKTT